MRPPNFIHCGVSRSRPVPHPLTPAPKGGGKEFMGFGAGEARTKPHKKLSPSPFKGEGVGGWGLNSRHAMGSGGKGCLRSL